MRTTKAFTAVWMAALLDLLLAQARQALWVECHVTVIDGGDHCLADLLAIETRNLGLFHRRSRLGYRETEEGTGDDAGENAAQQRGDGCVFHVRLSA
jgi:hypothetical protein